MGQRGGLLSAGSLETAETEAIYGSAGAGAPWQ